MGNYVEEALEKLHDLIMHNDKDLVKDVLEIEAKINRLYWELYHIYSLLLTQPHMIGRSITTILDLYHLVLNLEQMGDRIAEIIILFRDNEFDLTSNPLQAFYLEIISLLKSNSRMIIDNVNKLTPEMANQTIENGEFIQKKCEYTFEECKNYPEKIIELFKITASLKSGGRNIQNIGEILFNLLGTQEEKK